MNSCFNISRCQSVATWAMRVTAVIACTSADLRAAEGHAAVQFARDVVPILVEHCVGCHNNRTTEGNYALHTLDRMCVAGDSGNMPLVAHNPQESYLYQKLIEVDEDLRMPQGDVRLPDTELETIRHWIEQGAVIDSGDDSASLVSLLPRQPHPEPPASYRRAIPVFAACFLPGGDTLATGGWHELLIWNCESGQLLRRIPNMPQRIKAIVVSRDQTHLAIGGGTPGAAGEIQLLPLESVTQLDAGDSVATVIADWPDLVSDVQFTADGQRLIAGGADNSLRCYDVATGRQLWQNKQHVDWITAVDVTDYGFFETKVANDDHSELFAYSTQDQSTGEHIRQIWDFGHGHWILRESNWELETNAAAPGNAADNIRLTRITETGVGKNYRVERAALDAAEQSQHADLIGHLQEVRAQWHAPGDCQPFVVSASRDRTIKVFSLSKGELFTTYKGHRREYGPLMGMHRVYVVATPPDSRLVWSGGEGHHWHGWDPVVVRDEDGTAADMEARFAKEYSTAILRHDFVSPVFAWSLRRNQLIAGSEQGDVLGYPIAGGDAKFDIDRAADATRFIGHRGPIYSVAVSNDGRRVAAVGFSGQVTVWSTENGAVIRVFTAAPCGEGQNATAEFDPPCQ